MNQNIDIDDLEENDIVYVNKEHGYCMVIDTHIGLNNSYIIEFETTGLMGTVPDIKFSKRFNSSRKFKLFE